MMEQSVSCEWTAKNYDFDTLIHLLELTRHFHYYNIYYLDPKNFATIRTTSIVQRQQKDHLQDNEMHDQMSGYKRLRRDHQVINNHF